ncbi:MAG: hypothetical protein DDT32_01677 [Syntrophomonadaceae bacterium]|nr:hypothetical protein [Bacillota bacterium]
MENKKPRRKLTNQFKSQVVLEYLQGGIRGPSSGQATPKGRAAINFNNQIILPPLTPEIFLVFLNFCWKTGVTLFVPNNSHGKV